MEQSNYAKFLVVNKKNVVFHVYNERVLIERARSNAGMTEPTAFSVINTLNRMLDWILQNPSVYESEADTDYNYIVSKLFNLISSFNMSTIDTHVNDLIEYGLDSMGEKYTIFSAKKEYYTKNMDIFTKDNRIISIIDRYINAISVDNTEKPKREKSQTDKAYLTPPQFYTFCMLFVFSRIYYICWLTVMGAGDYTQMMKDSVFGTEDGKEGLSQMIFEHVIYTRYPKYIGLLEGPKFIDVFIYQYIASFVTSQSITNKVLIDKFKIVGMNEYTLYDKVISEIFSGIHRIVPSLELSDDGEDSKKDDYDGTEPPQNRKYYFKKIAKYISSSITEILRNVITNYKPTFIMNTDASSATDKENFDSIVNENKEHNQFLFAIKKDINEDAVASIRTDTLYLYENNAFSITKHKLGKFMISQYLSIKYGITEPVNVLTHAEYINLILSVYDRLDDYPCLKMALVGVQYEQKNNSSISLEDFEKMGCEGIPSFLSNNVHKTLKILSDLSKDKYRSEVRVNGISATSINDIRENLMKFMLNIHEVFA